MTPRTGYEITLRGPAPARLLAELGDVVQVVEPVQTVLVTDSIDQEALHRLVRVIRDLGLELVEVRRLAPAGDRDGGSAQQGGD